MVNWERAYREEVRFLELIEQFLRDVNFWTDELQDKWDNEYHPRNWKKGQVVCEGEEE